MNHRRQLLFSALCLTSFGSLNTASEAEVSIPAGTEAISSAIDLGGDKPGSIAFSEHGGIMVFPFSQGNHTQTTRFLRVNPSDGKTEQIFDSPTPTSGAYSLDGTIFLGGSPEFHIVNKKGELRTFAKGFGVTNSPNKYAPIAFTLGMDGRIYGTFNDSGLSISTNTGSRVDCKTSGAIFRFELDGSGFEIVHRGLVSPAGIAFNQYGDAFTVDSPTSLGDKARLIRIIEGGDSGWHSSYRKQKASDTPWMSEKIWETRNDSQPGFSLPASAYLTSSPHGLVYHPGTGFLENETGRFLICDHTEDLATSGIISFGIAQKRGIASIIHPRQIISGIKSSGLAFTSDGKLVVTNATSDKELLSFDPGDNSYLPDKNTEAATLLTKNFDQLDSTALAALLGHPNTHIRLRAQIALTRKKDAIDIFKKSLESDDLLTRVHAIQGLGIVARRGSSPSPGDDFTPIPLKGQRESAAALIAPLITDPNPEIRVQALRATGDAPLNGDTLPLGALLEDDSDRVRVAAAIAIGKLKSLGQYSAIISFLAKNNARDPYLSHAGAYALQHIAANDRQISALAVYQSAAVRLAAVVALRRMGSLEVVRFINDQDPTVQDEVIRAVTDLKMTAAYPMLAELLASSPREWPTAMRNRFELAKANPN